MKKSMKFKLLFVLLAAGITAAQTALTASAEDFSSGKCGDNATWALSADGTLTISGSGAMYDYKTKEDTPWHTALVDGIIQKVVTDDTITTIGQNAFCDCKSLTEVVLGSKVSSVKAFAFSQCSSIHTFTPGDATIITDSAFNAVNKITTVNLRSSVTELAANLRDMDSVTSFNVEDSDNTGYYTVNGILYHRKTNNGEETKTLVKVPEGIQLSGTYIPEAGTDIIGAKAFEAQKLLTEVILPETVFDLQMNAFYDCDSLKSLTVGNNTSAVENVFHGGTPISSVYLRNSVTGIADAVRDLDTVTEFIVDDTDGIGYYDVNGILYHYAEDSEESVKTLVKVPEGTQLTEYTAENGTNIIGAHAFDSQKKLEKAVLPASVHTLSEFAFSNCTALKGIYFYGNPPSMPNSALPASSQLTLYYIEGNGNWMDPWNNYNTEPFDTQPPVKGDVNGDDSRDEYDLDIMLRYFAGWKKRFSNYFDMLTNLDLLLDFDGDEKFTAKDRMILSRFLAEWENYKQYFETSAD